MTVVQRCPNCGTTKATPGECEACHEAQVRYFCTSHSPGVWLDAPACPRCGSRFGEAPRPAKVPATAAAPRPRAAAPRSVPPPATRRATTPAPTRPTAYSPSRGAAPSPRFLRPDPFEDAVIVRRAPERRAAAGEGALDPRAARMEAWQKLLRTAVMARAMRARVAPAALRPRVGRGAGGCLMRLLMPLVLLIVAIVSAVLMFGSALLGL